MSTFGDDPKTRKKFPMFSGLVKYFPDALAKVSHLSYVGNEQHNPGQPLRWAKDKSTDHLDALLRHIIDEDWDAVAWRALAHLQTSI